MKSFYTLLAVVALAGASASAEVQRYRILRRNGALRANSRFFARQEEAPVDGAVAPATADAAPYPAAGVTPEVPFELPTETDTPTPQPDLTYGPPDNTYGPPDNQEQIPTAEDDEEPGVAASGDGDLVSQNLIQPRNRNTQRFGRIQSAAPLRQRSFSAPSANIIEIIRSEPVIVYTIN